jgi:hypothetical protein
MPDLHMIGNNLLIICFSLQINEQEVEVTFDNPALGDHFDKLKEMKGFKEWIQRMEQVLNTAASPLIDQFC